MKKKIFTGAIIVICLSILAAGTIAYFTDEDIAHGVITSDAIDVLIEEWQEVDGELVPYPNEPIAIMPGTTVSKIVTVKNIDADAYIRANIDIIIMDAMGNEMELDEETIASILSFDFNTEDWLTKSEDDGWFYFNGAVFSGDVTTSLFTELAFSGVNMTNEYQNCTVEIVINAQGVQVANNGDSALEAAGWPANE